MRALARQIRRSGALAAAALAALACSRPPDAALRVRTLSPGQGDQGTAVAVRIEGDGLEPHVLTDYGDEGASVVDARFRAWLGAARLRDVRPSGDGALLATVPEDLPAGTYDLAVEDPAGNRGTLGAAYRVLAPTDAGALVASFRFDPVADAIARAPFAVTVTALDAAGQVVTGFSGTVALGDRSGALVPASIGPFAWGAWTGPVEVRAAQRADALTASDGLGHAGTSNDFAVLPPPAARVTFASAPVDAIAGACAGPVTVALEDLYGAPTSALAPVDVAVAGGAAAVYADLGCAVPSSGASIPAGATSAAVYVRATIAAPFTLDAAAPGLAPATQPGLVRPAAPARLVFTTATQTLTAGTCSAAAAVGSEDAYGNVAPVAADTTVSLSSSAAAGLTFHGAAGCGAPAVAAVTLPAGGAAATFWFRATAAEPVTVTAAGAGIPTPGTQGETIVAAAPVALAFVTASQTTPAGSCSGLATVEARDAFGNPAAVAAATPVALAASPASSFSFHLDAACGDASAGATSLAAGTSRASFRFRATATGPYDVTATGAGLPGAAAQTETVGPAAPDRVVFTTAPRAPRAGQCSGPLGVEIRDGLGNPAPVAVTTSVALAASPSAGTQLFATADCSGSAGGPATVAAGSAAATFSFRSTAAGPLDVTATVAGLVPGTQAETVLPDAPDRLVFTSAPLDAAAGSCSAAATVEARDAYGNVAPVAAVTPVALSAAPGDAFAFYGSAGCGGAPVTTVDLAAGGATTTFWFRGTAAGPVTVTAAGAGIATPATQGETVVPAAPDRLVFTSAAQSVVAGSCSAAAAFEARDAYGNVAPVAGATPVSLSAAPGSGFAFYGSAACGGPPISSIDLPAGASSAAVWFRGTGAGPVSITAAGAGIPGAAAQGETILPAPPDRLVFTSPPQSVTAGSCSAPLAIEVRDVHGNVAPVAAPTAVTLAAAPGSGFAFFASAGCGGAPISSVGLPAGASSAAIWFRGTAAGAVTVGASAPAIANAASQAETLLPSTPDRLVFTSAPQAVVAGLCSGAATVEARDPYGNVAPVAGLTAVALSAAPAAGFAFFGAAGCGSAPVGSVDVAAGASAATFWFRGTAAGTVTVGASGAGIAAAASQLETVEPAPPAAVVFTSPPQSVVAGSCSAAARLELRDAFGNPTSDPGAATGLAVSASPAAGFQLFDDAGCATPIAGAGLRVSAGAVGKDLWFRGTVATAVTLGSSPSGLAAASQVETIVPAAPDRLVFTTAPQAVVAGSCSGAVTVEARDVHGNAAPVAALTSVALSASLPAGFSFHASAGCGGAPVASVDLAAGASSATFWFSGTAAGPVTVTAAAAGVPTAASQAETVAPAAPDRLVFTSAPQTVVAGACSGAATFEARDAYGNVAPVAGLTTVALSAAPAAGLQLFDAAGCGGAAVASLALPAGATGGTLWFRGTVAGAVTVTAAGAGVPTAAAQPETIGPAAPQRLVFTTAAQTVSAGSCSGIATVEALDAFGNVAPVAAPTAVSLSASPAAGLAFHDAAGCGGAAVTSVALAAGASSASFTFRSTVAGAVTLTAAAAGVPGPAAQGETISPAAPDRLVFATAPQTATAGACSGAATVTVLDTLGNVAPVGALTAIALSASPAAGFGFYGVAGCGGPPLTSVDLAAGTASATFWFRGTAAGPVAVTATGAGIPNAAAQVETVEPAAPASVVFASAPQIVIAGACSGAIRVELRDAFGNPTADAAALALALAASPAAGFAFFEDPACAVAVPGAGVSIPAGSGGKDFWFKGTVAADVTVASAPAGLAGANQVETVRPAAPARLVFTSPPLTATAGACSGLAALEARDAYGNVAPVAVATSVVLGATPAAGFALHDAAGCGGAPVGSVAIAAGTSAASFRFRGTVARTVDVTATAAGIASGAAQTETVVPAPPDRLVFTSAPQSSTAGSCSGAATVEALDPFGNVAPVAAATAVALSAAPPAGFAFFDAAGCGGAAVASVDLAAAAASATFWFRGTLAGTVSVTATGAGIASAAAQAETIVSAAPERLVFTSPPQTVVAGACSAPATVEARDAYGNVATVAAPAAVALSSTPATGLELFGGPGCAGAPVTTVDLAAGASGLVLSFRGTVAGGVTIGAAGTGIAIPASQAETIGPAAPDRLVFTSPPQTVVAGACSATATVEARDAYGNVAPVSAATPVALSASPAAGLAFHAAAGCGGAPLATVTLAAGASTAAFRFSGTAAGTLTVTAAAAGIATSAAQAETVDPAAPATVVFTSLPQIVTAGACSGTTRIELRDAFGNATADAGAPTALALSASPAAGFELFEDPGCAVAVPGASIEIAAGMGGKDLWFRGTLATAVTLSSAPAGLAGASQTETVIPGASAAVAFAGAPQTVVAGACSAPVAVVALDAWGNVAPVAGPTTVALSAAPAAGFELHDAAGCGGAPVTTAAIAAGGTTATFRFRGTAAGPVTVTAAAFASSASQDETVSAAAPERLVFTTAPRSAPAGACQAATVEARDAFGNVAPAVSLTPVALGASPAAGFAFHDAAGCGGAAVTSVDLAAGASARTFWFRGTAAGAVGVTASGAGIAAAATQTETIVPAAPDRLVFTTAAQTVAAGTCAQATIEARDAYGNPSPVAALAAVALSAAPAAGFAFFDGGGCGGAPVVAVDLAAGASSRSFWFRGTAAGPVAVTASGAGIATAAAQTETVTPAAPARLVFGTPAQTVTAGACSLAATIEARDAYDNVAPAAALTPVSLSAAPSSGFELFDAAGCAGAAVASVDLAAGASSRSFWFRGTVAGAVTVGAAGAGIPTAASQVETVAPAAPDRLVFTSLPQTVQAGSCSGLAAVEARDPYGNVAPVAAATTVALAASPAIAFDFHDAAGCGGAPVGSVVIAAGASGASFRFRGTAVGPYGITATAAGIPAVATQPETVIPGPTDHFVFDPVATIWIRTWGYALRAKAVDAWGNATPAFTDTATLELAVPQPPNGAAATLSCPAGCPGGVVTSAFVAGVWTGSVAVAWADADPQKLGVSVRAAGSGAFATVSGSSGAFDVIGAVRSPPNALVTASPVVVRVNQPVAFDASGSTDYQTPAASLAVSWDFQATSTAVPAYPTPSSPWTAWTTTKTASNVYTVAGTYQARVAVRDADGDVGFGSVNVVVLPLATTLCTVTTAADVDDNATSCAAPGPDGVLSFAEALRVAPNTAAITFAAPYTITGSGSFTIARDDLTIAAPAGTVLDGKSLTITGNRAHVYGLELANQSAAVVVGNKKTVTLEDCYLHDMPGITDYGTLALTRVKMARCAGSCLFVTDATNSDTLTIRHSTFLGGGGAVGVDIAQCKAGKAAIVSQSNVFAGLATGVRFGNACPGYGDFRNNTFASNGVGIQYQTVASPNHVLRDNVFSGHTVASVSCGTVTFVGRDYHLLYQNASDGCIAGDPSTVSGQNPLYQFAAAGDYRVELASPAVDSAVDLGLFLVAQYPATAPRWLGLGPDRGGRESW